MTQLVPDPQAAGEPVTEAPRGLKDLGGIGLVLSDFPVEAPRAALVIVDLQYFDASRSSGIGRLATEEEAAALEPYFSRVERLVVPNVRRLVDAAHSVGVPCMFVRLKSPSPTGSGWPWRYRSFRIAEKLGDKEEQFLEEVSPEPTDYVFDKSTQSVFNSTNIDHVLRNLSRDILVVCGVVTDGCVEGAVRDAADHGYRVALVEDACAALTSQAHAVAINRLDRNLAIVKSAADVVGELERSAV